MVSSPGWLLRQALKPALGWDGSRPVVVLLLGTLFTAGYALSLRWLLRARTGSWRDPAARRAPFMILLLELATVGWWLWPWYATW